VENSVRLSGFLVLAAISTSVTAFAQEVNRCADCHLTWRDAPGTVHVQIWDRSEHGRNNVGCAKCHGGDPASSDASRAHRNIVRPGHVKSPLNPRNIPATCGSCHVGQFVAFQESRHYQLLLSGSSRGPTCVTCHGDVDGTLLSPKALESRCNSCHGPREQAPRAERARNARELYESLKVVREELKLANSLIKRINDRQRREDLMTEYRQAQVPVTVAIVAGHKFVYDDLRTSVGQAQTRVSALLARLANRSDGK